MAWEFQIWRVSQNFDIHKTDKINVKIGLICYDSTKFQKEFRDFLEKIHVNSRSRCWAFGPLETFVKVAGINWIVPASASLSTILSESALMTQDI